jgi:hypothetical protein
MRALYVRQGCLTLRAEFFTLQRDFVLSLSTFVTGFLHGN